MKNLFALPIFLLLLQSPVWAQFNATVRSARPGQSIDPYSVGKGVYQLQNGLYAGGSNYKGEDIKYRYFSNQAVFRVGLSERAEANIGWNYRNEQRQVNDSLFRQDGTELNAIGLRLALQEAKGAFPALGAQISLRFPALGLAYRNNYLAPTMILTANGDLNPKWNYTLNLGLVYDGASPQAAGIYTANLAHNLSDKWSVFIESYGNFSDTHFENRWDAGIAWLVANDFQLDFYGGAGYNDELWDYFCAVGISWRYAKNKEKNTNEEN